MLCRPKYPVITLTTDFGLQDHYVASVKGVLLTVNPATQIVDITHQLPPFSIESGAYAISQAAPCFPPGTVHVVVVDPGVGTERRAVLLLAAGQVFIAPDNGVLTLIAKTDAHAKSFEITRRDLMRAQISNTFHGRDLFAPVAAAVAAGKVAPSEVGPEISDLQLLDGLWAQEVYSGAWQGRILSVDRFGNLVTNLPASAFESLPDEDFTLEIGGHSICEFRATFGQGQPGTAFAYFGSSGYVEVGINRGNAAQFFGASAGQLVTLRRILTPAGAL